MVFTCNGIYILSLVNMKFPCGVINRLIEATEACRVQRHAYVWKQAHIYISVPK